MLGGFMLGMFFPWANSIGAFIGMTSSFIFILWMGMGQTVALYVGTYVIPTKYTTIEGCPESWIEAMPPPEEPE